MGGKKPSRNDHDEEHDAGEGPEIPHDVEIAGRWIVDEMIAHECDDGKSCIEPLEEGCFLRHSVRVPIRTVWSSKNV